VQTDTGINSDWMIPPDSPAEIVDTIDQVMRQALEVVITTSAGSAKDPRYARQENFCPMELERWAEICRLVTFDEDDRKTEACK